MAVFLIGVVGARLPLKQEMRGSSPRSGTGQAADLGYRAFDSQVTLLPDQMRLRGTVIFYPARIVGSNPTCARELLSLARLPSGRKRKPVALTCLILCQAEAGGLSLVLCVFPTGVLLPGADTGCWHSVLSSIFADRASESTERRFLPVSLE